MLSVISLIFNNFFKVGKLSSPPDAATCIGALTSIDLPSDEIVTLKVFQILIFSKSKRFITCSLVMCLLAFLEYDISKC
jgi:hypothetical protein